MGKYISLKDIWTEFAQTGTIHPHVRSFIAESWERCRELGLDMYESGYGSVASEEEFKIVLETNRDLIEVAAPIMDYLWSVLKGTLTVISLSDKDCNILMMRGDETTMRRFAKYNFKVGACWSESQVGTNALNLCIDLDMPIQTAGEEQYCEKHHRATGSGAPIHNENKEIIGSINITSDMGIFSSYSLGMVTAAAKLIDDQIELINANRLITYGVNSMSDGMIVTDSDFNIKTINNRGCLIFNEAKEKLTGLDLRGLLEKGLDIENIGKFNNELVFSVNNKTIYCVGRISTMTFNNSLLGVTVVFRTEKSMNKAVNIIAGNRATYTFDDIKTQSANMLQIIKQAKLIAKEECNLLIFGESGTGKEIFAQAIHNESNRANGPFVAINCAALPKDLVESELFGYEAGAFTGAKKEGQIGKFELANGGTILLDEIGEMPLEAQAKLLRVLESKKVTRIGGEVTRNINVRVIAVTNKDLQTEVQESAFRLDLFYRINIVSIEVPKLNDRIGDIRFLANFFFDRLSSENRKAEVLGEDFIKCLENYEWRGNVRQLQNVIARAYYLCGERIITKEYLPNDILNFSESHSIETENGPLDIMEKNIIIDTIVKNNGNITRSAKDLNWSKPTIYRKMRKYNIIFEDIIKKK